jgi:hypothetical protein
MEPFRPFRVQVAIRFLVLGLKDTNDSVIGITAKVRSTGALADACGLYIVVDSTLHRVHDLNEALLADRYRFPFGLAE